MIKRCKHDKDKAFVCSACMWEEKAAKDERAALLLTVRELSQEYARDVQARKDLGDTHAEYHAQLPKVRAYKLLMDTGLTPKQAIAEFQRILGEVEKT